MGVDMTETEWVWLQHPETGGTQRAHASTVDTWRMKGWQDLAEPPDEPNPAIAEYVPREPVLATIEPDVPEPKDEPKKEQPSPAGLPALKWEADSYRRSLPSGRVRQRRHRSVGLVQPSLQEMAPPRRRRGHHA